MFKDSNNRFVSVGKKENNNGEMPKFVILQRTRREHYNLVYAQSDRSTGKNNNRDSEYATCVSVVT